MGKYSGARNVSMILRVLGFGVLVFGIIGLIVLLVSIAGSYGAGAEDVIAILISYGIMIIAYSLLMFAAAYMLDIVRDVEKNTRDTADFLIRNSRQQDEKAQQP